MDIKKKELPVKEVQPKAITIKHSLFVIRDSNDKFEVSIEGTLLRADVMKMLRAAEREMNKRKARGIPLTKSA